MPSIPENRPDNEHPLPDHDGALFEAALCGLEPSTVRVTPLTEIEAVGLTLISDIDGASAELVLSPLAAVQLAIKLTNTASKVAFSSAVGRRS